MKDAKLLPGSGESLRQGVLQGGLLVFNNNLWCRDAALDTYHVQLGCEEVEALLPFVVYQGKKDWGNCAYVRQDHSLEEGYLKPVGVLRVVEVQHPPEALLLLLAPWVSPYKAEDSFFVIWIIPDDVADVLVNESLDQSLGRCITAEPLLVVPCPHVLDVFLDKCNAGPLDEQPVDDRAVAETGNIK